MNPKISVLVPFYNVQSFFERCVRSLMEQTFQDLEYIFVDDASTDCSLSVLSSVIEDYPARKHQIQVIKHSKNQGVAAVRNTALSLAKGEYIFWCDSDDWVNLDFCTIVYAFAKSHNSDLVICDFYHEYGDRTELEYFKEFKTYQSLIDNTCYYWWGLFCRFMKRAIIEEHHLSFYPKIDMWEDVGFSVRLHYYAKHITYLHEPFYHYNRINPNSILNQSDNPQLSIRSVYYSQRMECIRLLTMFLADKHLSSRMFEKKARVIEVDSIIASDKSYTIDRSYRDTIPFFLRRSELPLPFRIVVSFALLGFVMPLRLYKKLSMIRHGRTQG